MIVGGNTDSLSQTSDYKEKLDSGFLKLKKGKKFQFDSSSITFEDGTSEHVDIVVNCTGFEFVSQNMLEIEQEFWPLY